MMRMPWQLLVISGDAEPTRLQVDGPILIGRDPQCDLRLFDEACSRFHALVEPLSDGVRVRDQGSRNGVWCQDRQVRDSNLRDDVLLRVGDTRLLLQDPQGEQARTAVLSDQGTSLQVQPVRPTTDPGDADLARLVARLPAADLAHRAEALIRGLRRMLPQADAALVLRGSVVAGNVPARLALRLAQGSQARVLSLGQDLVGQTVAAAAIGSALVLPLGDGHLVLTRGLEAEAFTMAEAQRWSGLDALAGHAFRLRAHDDDDLGIVGSSPIMQHLRVRIRRLAATPAPVLISGPSGSGKELIARALHACSAGADAPFVAVNCAALPESLFEAELFGHAKGAFTGAEQARPGLIRSADGGSLFLDEIGEMPLPLQAKLLRVIQDGVVQGVGESKAQAVRVRFLAASNRDLHTEVADGRFREDLFYRLDVLRVHAPALSERREDIPELARHLLQTAAREHACMPSQLTDDALRQLQAAAWPGNVRQLQNTLVRAMVLAGTDAIAPEHLEMRCTSIPAVATDPDAPFLTLAELEARHVHAALVRCQGNRSAAARLLGISRPTLRRKLVEYGLSGND